MVLVLIVVFKTLDNLSGIVGVIGSFLRILTPFFLGVLFFYFLYRPAAKLERVYGKAKWKFFANHARLFSVLSVYLVLIFAMSLISALIIPILIQSIIDFASQVPGYLDVAANWVEATFAENSLLGGWDLHAAIGNLSSHLLSGEGAGQLASGVIGVGTGIFNVVVGLVVSLYVLLEREKIAAFFDKLSEVLFKEKTRKHLKIYLKQVNHVLFSFISGKSLDSIINFVTVTTILLVLQVEYALLFGVIAGLANFIPFLGSLFAVIFIVLVTLLTGGVEQAFWVLIPLLIFQQLDANFIEPRIMSYRLKISPILTIFAVLVGGAYFGIAGMFLAVPVIVIIKQILLEYINLNVAKKRSTN
jgi:predicted PurR-regulated permease PerM